MQAQRRVSDSSRSLLLSLVSSFFGHYCWRASASARGEAVSGGRRGHQNAVHTTASAAPMAPCCVDRLHSHLVEGRGRSIALDTSVSWTLHLGPALFRAPHGPKTLAHYTYDAPIHPHVHIHINTSTGAYRGWKSLSHRALRPRPPHRHQQQQQTTGASAAAARPSRRCPQTRSSSCRAGPCSCGGSPPASSPLHRPSPHHQRPSRPQHHHHPPPPPPPLPHRNPPSPSSACASRTSSPGP